MVGFCLLRKYTCPLNTASFSIFSETADFRVFYEISVICKQKCSKQQISSHMLAHQTHMEALWRLSLPGGQAAFPAASGVKLMLLSEGSHLEGHCSLLIQVEAVLVLLDTRVLRLLCFIAHSSLYFGHIHSKMNSFSPCSSQRQSRHFEL